MISTFREMPGGVRLFLAYALLILALIGISLPAVVNLAVDTPISGVGLLSTLLLAYTIFTVTLVLQRKQAAWIFSQGLATLTIPLIPFLWFAAGLPGALFAAALAALLFRGLRGSRARAWFSEV
jgi:hypothetical protein